MHPGVAEEAGAGHPGELRELAGSASRGAFPREAQTMEGRAVARYFSGLPKLMQLASSEENREPLPMRWRLDRGSAE